MGFLKREDDASGISVRRRQTLFLLWLILFLAWATFVYYMNFHKSPEERLGEAARDGRIETVRSLIDGGTDIETGDHYCGLTPLMWATFKCHPNIIELLLAEGADIDAKDEHGAAALMYAVNCGCSDDENCQCTEAVHILLSNGADLNAKDESGETALTTAAQCGCTDILESLLLNGADVKARDNIGRTALMSAVCNGHLESAEMLLENGAEVNATDNDGNTALIYAANHDRMDIIRTLLSNEADVNIRNDSGHTPLTYATSGGHTRVAQLLEQVGAEK